MDIDILFISLEWWRGTLVSMAVHSLLKSDALWSIMICFSGDSPNTPCRLFFACQNQPWGSLSVITRESEARVMVRKPPPPSNCNICSLSFWQTSGFSSYCSSQPLVFFFCMTKIPLAGEARGSKGTKSLPLPPPWVWETHPPTSLSPGEMYEWETKTQWRFARVRVFVKAAIFTLGEPYPWRQGWVDAPLPTLAALD